MALPLLDVLRYRAPSFQVMIWDDHQGKCIGELTFKSQVRSAQCRPALWNTDMEKVLEA